LADTIPRLLPTTTEIETTVVNSGMKGTGEIAMMIAGRMIVTDITTITMKIVIVIMITTMIIAANLDSLWK
jgi:hypothetical protein